MKYSILYKKEYNYFDRDNFPTSDFEGLYFFHGNENESKESLLERFIEHFFTNEYFAKAKQDTWYGIDVVSIIQCGEDSDFDFNLCASNAYNDRKKKAESVIARFARIKQRKEAAKKAKAQADSDRATYLRLKARFERNGSP